MVAFCDAGSWIRHDTSSERSSSGVRSQVVRTSSPQSSLGSPLLMSLCVPVPPRREAKGSYSERACGLECKLRHNLRRLEHLNRRSLFVMERVWKMQLDL